MEEMSVFEDKTFNMASIVIEDANIWSYMKADELLSSALTLRELLRHLHDPKRMIAEQKKKRRRRYCCAHVRHNKTGEPVKSECEYFDVNGNHRRLHENESFDYDITDKSHNDCPRFDRFRTCSLCKKCKTEAIGPLSTTPETFQSIKKKQKNDREAMLQKLSKGDPDIDSVPFGSDKPWYQPRLERSYSGNNQNLQICYINNSCSSSDSEEAGTDSKTSPSSMGKSSTSSPVLSSPGFGTRRNLPSYRMSSSSSTVSLSSTSSAGHHNSSSSLPGDGEIINIRPSINTDDIPKPKTKQEQLELQARIAITQAHQEARRLAAEERRRNRKGSNASTDRLLNVPLDDATRLKVKTRSLSRDDCHNMTDGQLQVILNNMHAEKEALNDELKVILELRDDLRTEQDAKLIDVDDYKAMLSATGPETTV